MKNTLHALLALLALASEPAFAALPNPLPKAPQPVDAILQLQIFLDGQLFGPGKLDGRPGEFTTKALKRYQRAHGLPETELDSQTLDLSSVTQIYTTYTIREEDLKFVGDSPIKPAEQSKKKYLPYGSLEEFLTERFHCAEELIEFINRPKKLDTLKPGDVVKVPNVQPFLIEELTPIGGLPEVLEFKTRIVHIDTKEKMLDVFDGDKLLASLPITPGSGPLATPPGTWRILGIAEMPTFRWDKSVLEYGVRSKDFYELPIGPRNPVGVMWIGLNRPGIGIHGTNRPMTIGRSASHGCMRTANWDVVRLAKIITKGMTVVIEGPPPERRAEIVENVAKALPAPDSPAPEKHKGVFGWLFGKH